MAIGQLSFSSLEILLILQAVIYLLLLPVWFVIWLRIMVVNSPKYESQKSLSLMILIVATILWPISVPMSYWELLHKKKEVKAIHPATHRHLRLVN